MKKKYSIMMKKDLNFFNYEIFMIYHFYKFFLNISSSVRNLIDNNTDQILFHIDS